MKGDASKHEKSGDEQDTSTTKPDKTRQKSGLTQKQYNAIDALLAGATDQEAANKSGVSRQTVNGWKNDDPEFIEVLNLRREALWNMNLDQLRALVSPAVQVLTDHLNGNWGWPPQKEAAIHVLKAVGIYGKDVARPKPLN